MTATAYTLTTTPVQITDGTKSAYVQETVGSLTRFTTSDTSPNTSTIPYCTITKNDLTIAKGFKVWAWNSGTSALEIVVLTSEV